MEISYSATGRGKHAFALFFLHLRCFVRRSASSSNDPQTHREASNLSPGPVPKARGDGAAGLFEVAKPAGVHLGDDRHHGGVALHVERRSAEMLACTRMQASRLRPPWCSARITVFSDPYAIRGGKA